MNNLKILENIFDHIPKEVFIIDSNFKVSYLNQSMKDYVSMEAVFEKDFYLDNLLVQNKKLIHKVKNVFKGTQFNEYENDEIKYQFFPYYEDGVVSHVIAYKYDLKKSVLDDPFYFLCSAIHDIKEPIFLIFGYLNILSKKLEKPKLNKYEFKKIVKNAFNVTEKMINLMKDMFDMGKIKSQNIKLESINMNFIIQTFLYDFNEIIKNNNVTILTKVLSTIDADKNLIYRLMQNLILNAIKFKGKENPQIMIHEQSNENYWIFCVKDNGIGISETKQIEIFNIFKKSDKSKTGSGLGLAICKEIIEKHNGKIWVESKLNKGSSFYFSIKK